MAVNVKNKPEQKTYCSYCGKEETKIWTRRYLILTGEKAYRRECHEANCEAGRRNICVNNGGHFYPEVRWYKLAFFNLTKYFTCTKCGFFASGE